MTGPRNAQAILEVAEQIEQHPDQYLQCTFIREEPGDCGTVACIAGWRCVLDGFDYRQLHGGGGHAKERFGLSDAEADWLFAADWKPAVGMTVPQALRAIADGMPIATATNPNVWQFDWPDEDELLAEHERYVMEHA